MNKTVLENGRIRIQEVTPEQIGVSFGGLFQLPELYKPIPKEKEFNDEIAELHKSGTSLDDVRKAIDASPDIKDKTYAKMQASRYYEQQELKPKVSALKKAGEATMNIAGAVGERIDRLYGLPGRIAGNLMGEKGEEPIQPKTSMTSTQAIAPETRNRYVPKGFMGQVSGAVEAGTGSRSLGLATGFAAGLITPGPDETKLIKEVRSMKLVPLEKAMQKFDRTGLAILAEDKARGLRLVVKDEGEFVTVGMDAGTGKLLSTDIELPSGNFASKGEAFDFIRQLGQKKLPEAPPVYMGESDLSTKLLRELEGKSTISKQYLLDATNRGDLKQVERDVFRKLLADEGNTVNVKEFANRVKTELLPLKFTGNKTGYYENISLPSEQRGPIANYSEHIYESPIKTSAGEVHFGSKDATPANYFAHTRVEDLPAFKNIKLSDKQSAEITTRGDTRRVIEIQSDLFQKGNLEKSVDELPGESMFANMNPAVKAEKEMNLSKLEPYRNTWHERIIREEVKQAAKDGKTKLQFPTGETAMKIEGLGEVSRPFVDSKTGKEVTIDKLKVGQQLDQMDEEFRTMPEASGIYDQWVVTDVLGDGKFKAVPKDKMIGAEELKLRTIPDNWKEEFDISGKVDTSNPIYRFYEKDVQKFLQKFGAKKITDPQGVSWFEVDVNKGMAKEPVQAYGFIGKKVLRNAAIGTGVALGLPVAVDVLSNWTDSVHQNQMYEGLRERMQNATTTLGLYGWGDDMVNTVTLINAIKDKEKKRELWEMWDKRQEELSE